MHSFAEFIEMKRMSVICLPRASLAFKYECKLRVRLVLFSLVREELKAVWTGTAINCEPRYD